MTDQEMDEALRALRDEHVPFGSVRERVLARVKLDRKRGSVPAWMWIAASAALILLTLTANLPWRLDPMPQPQIVQIRPPEITPPKALPPRRAPRPSRPPAQNLTELTLKLHTPDPNVVIYWIVEGQGE
jgi:hypothetical protein